MRYEDLWSGEDERCVHGNTANCDERCQYCTHKCTAHDDAAGGCYNCDCDEFIGDE